MSDFDYIAHLGTLSADFAAMGRQFPTAARQTAAAVEAALSGLLANGYIRIVPADERPEWYTPALRHDGEVKS